MNVCVRCEQSLDIGLRADETAAATRREQEEASVRLAKQLQEEDEKQRRARRAADDEEKSQALVRQLTNQDLDLELSNALARELGEPIRSCYVC